MEGTRDRSAHERVRLFSGAHHTRNWVIACMLVALGLIVWRAANVFLLFFLCVLAGLFLRGVSDWSVRHWRVPKKWSLTITVLTLLAVFSAIGWLLAPEISDQYGKLREDLPRAVQRLEEHINQYAWGRQLTQTIRDLSGSAQAQSVIPKAANFLGSSLGVLGGLIVLAFVAIYLAADPARYVNGVVRLFPPRKRQRAREVFDAVGSTLQRWLMGQLSLMALNGVVTSIALALLGIPMALTLGILSALLNFVPNFGPIAAAVPAVLIAFLEGPTKALYVIIFYLAYQNLDGYVFTPIVQKRTVSLPPAVTIMSQVLMGVLLGVMGVLLAVPFAAMMLVLAKMVYVEDVFGEHVPLPSEKTGR